MKTEIDPKYLRAIERMPKTHYIDENGKSLCGLWWPKNRVSTTQYWFSAYHKCSKCKHIIHNRTVFI